MVLSSNAIGAKAKAMYGKRIQNETYHTLCNKENVHELISVLKTLPAYKNLFKNKQTTTLHRSQLEQLLQQSYYINIEKMLKYVPRKNKSFYLQIIYLIEIRLILDKLLQFIYPENTMTQIPTILEKYIRFNLNDFMKCTSLNQLKEIIYKVKVDRYLNYEEIESISVYHQIEKDLMNYYYDQYVQCIQSTFKGKRQKELLDILITSIELKNIEKMYRLKVYYEVENIDEYIQLKYSRLSKELIEELKTCTKEDFLHVLSKSKYQKYCDQDDFVYIEYYTEMVKYHIAKRFMRFSNDAPVVFMTYCLLQQIEINNLKHIIEGVRYQKDPYNIKQFLIYM